jgi:hypothetical protein
MGASKRRQMASFDEDWPDQIWSAAGAINGGRGARWKLALAAIAVTGCRPAALERGLTFSLLHEGQKAFIEVHIPGVKLTNDRGQPDHRIRWSTEDDTHRPEELLALAKATMATPNHKFSVSYDAEAISTRLRELSRSLWPRRKRHITAYCYRELLSSTAKAAEVDPIELAAALGHRSTESQDAYSRARRHKGQRKKPWTSVSASISIKKDRGFTARFKALTSYKKNLLRRLG